MSTKRLKDRLALVTGASRGLGRATAIALAREGAHLILTGRVVGALEETDDAVREAGGKATILQLDLRKGELIDQLGPTVFQRWGKLDILVGNAGILGPLSPLGHITTDSWAAVIETNLSANWRLIRTCAPLLRLSDAGRAIFVTSGAAEKCRAYWGPYSVSKAGLEALAKTFAAEMASTSVRVNLIDPGPMRTAMRVKAFPGEDPMTLPEPEDVAPLLVDLSLPATTRNGDTVDFRAWRDARAERGVSEVPELSLEPADQPTDAGEA